MRRVLWVLETKNHSRWGATLQVGATKKSVDPAKNPNIHLTTIAGQAVQYRIRRYEPVDKKPWWRFW